MTSPSPEGETPIDLGRVTHAFFEPLVGATFRVAGGGASAGRSGSGGVRGGGSGGGADAGDGGAVELVLTDASTWGSPAIRQAVAAGTHPRLPFRLEFIGPRGPVLPQGIHRLEHSAVGSFEPFLVPIGYAGDGLRYEAVFT